MSKIQRTVWKGTYRCRSCGFKNLVIVTSSSSDVEFRVGTHHCQGIVGKRKLPCMKERWISHKEMKQVSSINHQTRRPYSVEPEGSQQCLVSKASSKQSIGLEMAR